MAEPQFQTKKERLEYYRDLERIEKLRLKAGGANKRAEAPIGQDAAVPFSPEQMSELYPAPKMSRVETAKTVAPHALSFGLSDEAAGTRANIAKSKQDAKEYIKGKSGLEKAVFDAASFVEKWTNPRIPVLSDIPEGVAGVVDENYGENIENAFGANGLRITATDGTRVSPEYAIARDDRRSDVGQARKDNPATAIATEIGVTAPLPIAKIAKAPGLIKKVATGAVTAAPIGFAYGFNEGEGNLQDRAVTGTQTAALSAAAGGLLPPAISGISAAVRPAGRLVTDAGARLKSLITKDPAAITDQAERVAIAAVKRSMERSGMTVDDVVRAIDEYGDKPAVLADVLGQDAVNALTALTRKPGATAQKAQALVEERFSEYPQRLMRDIEETTNLNPAEISGNIEQQLASRRAAAAPAYERAFAEPYAETPQLATLAENSPFIQKHVKIAQDRAKDIAAQTGKQPTRVQFWDEVKRSMDGELGRMRNKADQGEFDRGVVMRLEDLRNQMLDQLPQSYAAARGLGGEAPRLEQAFKTGQRVLTNSRNAEDVGRIVGETNPQDIGALRSGAVRDIATRTEQGTLTPQRFRRPDQQNKLRTVFGDEAGNALSARLESEAKLRELSARYGPRMNSVTGTVLENGNSPVVDEVVRGGLNALSGNKIGLIGQVIGMMRRQGYSQAQQDAIGDLLLSNPREGLRRLGLDPNLAGSPSSPAPTTGNGLRSLANDETGSVSPNALAPIAGGGIGGTLGYRNPIDLDGDGEISESERVATAVAYAGLGATGGTLATRGRGKVDTSQTNVFAGPTGASNLAKGGNVKPQQALELAAKLEAQGANRDEIWFATAEHLKGTPYTGVHKGVDGKWRFEIDDSASRITKQTEGRLEGVLDHPSLFEAYPDARKIDTEIGADDVGQYLNASRSPTGREQLQAGGADDLQKRSLTLHELQHGLQERENFGRGGWPEQFLDDALNSEELAPLTSKWNELMRYQPKNAVDEQRWRKEAMAVDREMRSKAYDYAERKYRELSGEVEARNVQSRLDLTADQRRQTPPWRTQDTPEASQGVTFDTNPQASVFKGPGSFEQNWKFQVAKAAKARGETLTPEQKRLLGDDVEVPENAFTSPPDPPASPSALQPIREDVFPVGRPVRLVNEDNLTWVQYDGMRMRPAEELGREAGKEARRRLQAYLAAGDEDAAESMVRRYFEPIKRSKRLMWDDEKGWRSWVDDVNVRGSQIDDIWFNKRSDRPVVMVDQVQHELKPEVLSLPEQERIKLMQSLDAFITEGRTSEARNLVARLFKPVRELEPQPTPKPTPVYETLPPQPNGLALRDLALPSATLAAGGGGGYALGRLSAPTTEPEVEVLPPISKSNELLTRQNYPPAPSLKPRAPRQSQQLKR